MEMATDPEVLFVVMDGPDVPLSVFAYTAVMQCLRNVAHSEQKTVVVAMKGLSFGVSEALDSIVLLGGGGHMLYSGPVGQCFQFLREAAAVLPRRSEFVSAEATMDMLRIWEEEGETRHIHNEFRRSSHCQEIEAEVTKHQDKVIANKFVFGAIVR